MCHDTVHTGLYTLYDDNIYACCYVNLRELKLMHKQVSQMLYNIMPNIHMINATIKHWNDDNYRKVWPGNWQRKLIAAINTADTFLQLSFSNFQ